MSRFDPVDPHPIQKIIIPKGTINPGETTIIEVPIHLHNQPVVVAKRKLPQDYYHFDHHPIGNLPTDPGLLYLQELEQPINDACVQGSGIASASNAMYKSIPNQSSQISSNLNETEAREKLELQRDLEEFQRARRKLLSSATKMASRNNNISEKILQDIAAAANKL